MSTLRSVVDTLGSAAVVRALTLAVLGLGALAFPIHEVLGWPALVAALSTLVLLCAGSFAGRQRAVEWDGILPISLLAFLGWCTVSVVWSGYQWATLSSSLYQLAFAALGIYVALMRDMIQIVRALGDVLRWVLGASLVLEVVVGILLDTDLRVLNIRGVLDRGGPIQGLGGDASHLGILALVAAVTFGIELLTRSVPLPLSVGSLAGSVVIILLTQSTVVLAAGLVVVLAAALLTAVRHAPDAAKLPITWGVIVLAILGAGLGVLFRARLLDAFAGSGQVANRRVLWERVVEYTTADHAVAGWGWIGHWRMALNPFVYFYQARGDFASAFNAYLDVFFQVGLVGLVCFIGLLGLVLARSWVLAVRQRSIVYLWPALIVVALIATSLTESAILVEMGWLMLVICVVTSAERLSWRRAFERLRPRTTGPELPRA